MNKTTRAKVERKAAETVKARHKSDISDTVGKVSDALKAKNGTTPVKVDKEIKKEKTTANLPPLPKLPSAARIRKDRPIRACACGDCGQTTKGIWAPGHDAYCKGWALRVERNIAKMSDVPPAVMSGVKLVLSERKKMESVTGVKPSIKIVKAATEENVDSEAVNE